jgi:hypothetical protein
MQLVSVPQNKFALGHGRRETVQGYIRDLGYVWREEGKNPPKD